MVAMRLPPVLDLVHVADMVLVDIEKTRSYHEMGRSVVFLFLRKRGRIGCLNGGGKRRRRVGMRFCIADEWGESKQASEKRQIEL